MKTAKIKLTNIKCSDGWFELCQTLFAQPNEDLNEEPISNKICYNVFEHGEYGTIEIEVDENFNIVGGKIIPYKPIQLKK